MIKYIRRLIKSNALVRESLEKPFRFSIDLVDACNLRCVICPRGVNYKSNTSKRMKLEVFDRLLDKMKSECACNVVELHNWTEPFLNPELDKYVAKVMARGMGCVISSNLSVNNQPLLESVLSLKPTLIVSVSGFEQEMHQRYHKGSKVDTVKKNLKFIASLQDKGLPQCVEVHCLQFVDNQEDQIMWERFCSEHGFKSVSRPAYSSEVATPETAGRLLVKPAFEQRPDGSFRPKEVFSEDPVYAPCPLHNQLPINCDCDVYLCCIYWNREEYRVGNYLDLSLKQIQKKRLSMRECSHCMVMRKS